MKILLGLFCGSVIITSSFSFANERLGADLSKNEDIQFIHDWKMQEKAKQVAQHLQLSESQVVLLRQVKAKVDEVKLAHSNRVESLKTSVESAASIARAQIEKEGQLLPEREQELKSFRGEIRKLRRTLRLELELAVQDLDGLLTSEQRDWLKTNNQSTRDRPDRHRQRSDRNARRQGSHKLVKLLLSDAFMSQL